MGEQAIKLFILNDNCHEPGVRQFASIVSNLPAFPRDGFYSSLILEVKQSELGI